jgi:GntR family transcriptional regulator
MPSQSATPEIQPEASGIDDFAVSIDRDADVPVGVQLGWALRACIRDGRFKPGQQLPTLRELAEATGLNVNTVRAVYQRLEHKGLIDSQQGSGTFVALARRRSSEVAVIAANAAQEASETGVDPREVAAALYVAPETSGQTIDAATAQRRVLRKQIAMLERAIGELEAKHPGVVPRSRAARRGVGPALLSNDELERVRAQVVRRLAEAQDAIDAHFEQTAREGEPPREPATARAGAKRKASKTPKRTIRPAATRPATTRPAPAGT